MTFTRCTLFVVLAGFAIPAVVGAQDASPRKPIELGVDAALVRDKNDLQTSTSLTLPVNRFRVGFFVTDAISLEP